MVMESERVHRTFDEPAFGSIEFCHNAGKVVFKTLYRHLCTHEAEESMARSTRIVSAAVVDPAT